jgi:hypothetical protein
MFDRENCRDCPECGSQNCDNWEDSIKRKALCELLERIGGDGVHFMLNKSSSKEVEDDIFTFVQHLESRAQVSERLKIAKWLRHGVNHHAWSESYDAVADDLEKEGFNYEY